MACYFSCGSIASIAGADSATLAMLDRPQISGHPNSVYRDAARSRVTIAPTVFLLSPTCRAVAHTGPRQFEHFRGLSI